MNDREIFLAALEIEDADERQAYLVDASAGDAELLARIEALLTSHEGQSEFLKVPVVDQLIGEGSQGAAATAWMEEESSDRPNASRAEGEEDDYTLGYLQPPQKPDSLGRPDLLASLESWTENSLRSGGLHGCQRRWQL